MLYLIVSIPDLCTLTYFRKLKPDTKYYVRMKVNGEAIPNKRICGGKPYSNACSFKVRLLIELEVYVNIHCYIPNKCLL